MKVAVLALLAALATAHTFVEDSQDYDHVLIQADDASYTTKHKTSSYKPKKAHKHHRRGRYHPKKPKKKAKKSSYKHAVLLNDQAEDSPDEEYHPMQAYGPPPKTGYINTRALLAAYEHAEGQGFTTKGAEETDYLKAFSKGKVLVGRRLRGAMVLVEEPEDDSASSDDLFLEDEATQDEGPSSAFAQASFTRTAFLSNQERPAVLLARNKPQARATYYLKPAKAFLGQDIEKRASDDDDDDDKSIAQAVGGLDLNSGRRTNYINSAKKLLGLGDGAPRNGMDRDSGRETSYLKPRSSNKLLAAKAQQSSSAFNSATKTDTNFLAKAIEDMYLTNDDGADETQDVQEGDGTADSDSQVDALLEDTAENQDYYQDELNGVYHPWNDWTPDKI